MKSRTSVAILLCVVLAVVDSSPTGSKKLQSKSAEQEKEINPTSKALGEDGDDGPLARAKKSSTTTFCVEIKPGTDQPAVVKCDPTNHNQQPLPLPTPPPPPPPAHHHHAPAPQPDPQPDPASYPEYHQYPQIIPDFPQLIPQLIPQLPSIFDPLVPQIFAPQLPQIPSLFSQQPQVIFVRDPSCPSNNPAIISNPSQFLYPGLVYPSGTYGKSAEGYPMNPAEFWKSGFVPEGDKIRSFTGPNGVSGAGYLSSLDAIYSKRGPLQLNSPNSKSPYMIQCNPTVIPLSQDYNSAASAAGSANYDPRLRNAMMEKSGKAFMEPKQTMYQPMAGTDGMYMTQGAMPYMRQSAMGNGNQYRSNAFPTQSQNMEAVGMGPMMSEANPLDHATEQIQGLLKSRQESRSSIDYQGPQGHQNVAPDARDSKALMNDQPQKTESVQSMEENQNMGGPAFAQGKNSFVQNAEGQLQGTNGNDQGIQRQMPLAVGQQQQHQQQQHQQQQQHHQQQQQLQQQTMPNAAPRNGGVELNHSQQPLTSNEHRLQMMRAAASQSNNMLQPFMIQQPRSVGDKQMQLKA